MEPVIQDYSVTLEDNAEYETADKQLVSLLQDGLPLCERPYEKIGRQIGLSESQVLERITALKNNGVIKRFGIIVRHHEVGYKANAMVVWNIPDSDVDDIAQQIIEFPFVTLCYRRPRRLPEWPYNLFCMIHGRDRYNVIKHLELLITANNLQNFAHDVLFNKRRFKQRGACYSISGKKAGDIEDDSTDSGMVNS